MNEKSEQWQELRKSMPENECEKQNLPKGSSFATAKIWHSIQNDRAGAGALAALRENGYEPNPNQICIIPFLPKRRAHSKKVVPPFGFTLAAQFLRNLAGDLTDGFVDVTAGNDQLRTGLSSSPALKLRLKEFFGTRNNGKRKISKQVGPPADPLVGPSRYDCYEYLSRLFDPAKALELATYLEVIASHRWIRTRRNPQHLAIALLRSQIRQHCANKPHDGYLERLLEATFRAAHQPYTNLANKRLERSSLEKSEDRERAMGRKADKRLHARPQRKMRHHA